jgi:pimeloyl-ACP methyl ester carboxylesterase
MISTFSPPPTKFTRTQATQPMSRDRHAFLALLISLWLLTDLPYHPAHAQPTSPAIGSTPATCTEGTQASGATYRICMPATWNNRLLIYAHGYVAPNRPVGIPEDQMTIPGTNTRVDQFVNAQGYAFATSGYSTNGLAIVLGLADLVDLVSIFATQQTTPTKVLLAGVSEGGLITMLAVEQYPELFDGGLALCGPYGNFRQQIDYFGDFRVAFDYFFPGLIPPSPVAIPSELLDTWETSTYSTTVKPVIVDPANASQLDQLLAVTGAPFNSALPSTKESTVERLLWYNIYATNDARVKLDGQPFDNQNRSYAGSTDDTQLNQSMQRFSADEAALNAIAAAYETTGVLTVPLITMHTTGDPVVPYWHAIQYRGKTIAADNMALHEHIQVNAYGHCQFSAFDVLGAFNRLVTLVDNPPPYRPVSRSYLPLVTR